MSLRDVEDLLATRGIIVSYETIRKWVGKFGTKYAASIRWDRPAPSGKWQLDEVIIPIRERKFGFGARSTAMVTFLLFWFNLGATLAQRTLFPQAIQAIRAAARSDHRQAGQL